MLLPKYPHYKLSVLSDKMKVTQTPIDLFAKFWLLVIPVTSFLLVPSVQGTTPGYVMAFLAMPIVFFYSRKRAALYQKIGIFILIMVLHVVISQIAAMLSDIDTSKLIVINPLDSGIYFRATLLTQGLYLFACVVLFIFTSLFYKPSWMKFALYGALALVLYGFYGWVHFLVTGNNGDFITNRSFEKEDLLSVAMQSEFQFQSLTIAGLNLLRLHSLTGEPSMFSITILPYFIYTMQNKNYRFAFVFLVGLILSTSSTAIIGLIVYSFLVAANSRKAIIYYFLALALIFAIYNIPIVKDYLDFVLFEKKSSDSANDRLRFFMDNVDFLLSSNFLVWLFGIGYGYVRSPDLLSSFLVNTGLVGTAFLLYIFCIVCARKTHSSELKTIKYILIVQILAMFVAVAELTYLPTWFFLGVGYALLRKDAHKEKSNKTNRPVDLFGGISGSEIPFAYSRNKISAK